ncbi:MAG: hypothetical protein ICPDIFCJ_00661 [Sodalis sp. Ppy]|nr:hypothetical protein [Sodalis sp. Ppy]
MIIMHDYIIVALVQAEEELGERGGGRRTPSSEQLGKRRWDAVWHFWTLFLEEKVLVCVNYDYIVEVLTLSYPIDRDIVGLSLLEPRR